MNGLQPQNWIFLCKIPSGEKMRHRCGLSCGACKLTAMSPDFRYPPCVCNPPYVATSFFVKNSPSSYVAGLVRTFRLFVSYKDLFAQSSTASIKEQGFKLRLRSMQSSLQLRYCARPRPRPLISFLVISPTPVGPCFPSLIKSVAHARGCAM